MPPLNALRAFEAAARHESFAKAADELGVTAAAVSQQVKSLEAWLGAELFARRAQGLALTEGGRAASPALSAAFDGLGRAVATLRGAASRADLQIAALPSIAQLWLGPRLAALRAAFPETHLSLHALETPPDLRREPFDLGLFFIGDAPRGSVAVEICADLIVPACAPAIAATVRSPSDLGRHPLLWDTRWADDWSLWLSAQGGPGLRTRDGPAFSLYSLAVQAALDGAGILMAHEVLVAGHLASGALVTPLPRRVPTGSRLAILVPDPTSPRTERLAAWLARDATQT